MTLIRPVRYLLLLLPLVLLIACSDGGTSSPAPGSLSADHINLIFVVTPDLAYSTAGDINPDTANLTSQGLQRSLMMATYLKQQVLGGNNVTGIYTISPMSHLQTANNYPNMAAIGFIQQFALLNQMTLTLDANGTRYTANSFTINASYARPEGVPAGVAIPQPSGNSASAYCSTCSGLDYNNTAGINDALLSGIIDKKSPGFFVFAAPWETVRTMLATITTKYNYDLSLPASYRGTNHVFAISIPTSGKTSLVTYNSNLNPPATYPVLPNSVTLSACTNTKPLQQDYFSLSATAGTPGVTIPATINKNSRIYIVRHAEAHPDTPNHSFDNGNLVAAGQWRALSLANTLRGKITPEAVYSIDPSAIWYSNRDAAVSYIRPSLTVLPYIIANNLPYYLAAGLQLGNPYNVTELDVAQATRDFFFFSRPDGSSFSNQTILVAWESGHIRPFLNELIKSFGATLPQLDTVGPPTGGWISTDYDTIWTVTLDAQGNLTIHNGLCEGINSSMLPDGPPMF